MAGFGLQKFGTTPFGAGTPIAAPIFAGVVLRDDLTGLSSQGRYIDPSTNQYVFDSFGRMKGTSEVRQLVYMAAKTVLGSSAQTTLGQSLGDIKTIGPTFAKQVSDKLRSALQPIVDRKLMVINNIDVQQMADNRSRVVCVLRWTDTTTGKEEAFQL